MFISDFIQLSEVLPPNTDITTLTLSNQPAGGDKKSIKDIAKFKVSQIGLK
jgi:nuclear protein localization family protein 4